MDWTIPYEQDLLFLINGAHSPFMDYAMWLYSGYFLWIIPAAAFLFTIIYGKKSRQWVPVLCMIALVFALCHISSAVITKPLFDRFRPVYFPGVMEHVRTVHPIPTDLYGFISGHAANSFGFAMFTALLFCRRFYSIVIFGWALVMAYSRVYLGVHFISDILGGIAAGMLIGWGVYSLYKYVVGRTEGAQVKYSYRRVTNLAAFILGYVLLFFIWGWVYSALGS